MNVCCLNHTVCGALLWQPYQSNTEAKCLRNQNASCACLSRPFLLQWWDGSTAFIFFLSRVFSRGISFFIWRVCWGAGMVLMLGYSLKLLMPLVLSPSRFPNSVKTRTVAFKKFLNFLLLYLHQHLSICPGMQCECWNSSHDSSLLWNSVRWPSLWPSSRRTLRSYMCVHVSSFPPGCKLAERQNLWVNNT